MSQAGANGSGGPLPPTVPLQFTTDDLLVEVPSLNNLNIYSQNTYENNNNGIRTEQMSVNTVGIIITNRLQGTSLTSGANIADIIVFDLGLAVNGEPPATYIFEFRLCAHEQTTPAGAGYFITGTVRTDGVTGTIINIVDASADEDAALTAADWDVVISVNNLILRVTGVDGLDLYWSAVGMYTKAFGP